MINALRLFFICLFFLAACHEDPVEKPANDPPGNANGDTVSNDTASTDTTQNDSLPSDSLGEVQEPVLTYYYPPSDQNTWEKISPDSLGWNTDSLQQLLDFVKEKNTYGFIILYKGRIVTEQYWNEWNAETKFMIASAGKSVTSFLMGIAQQEKIIDINNKTSTYLGQGWTSAPLAKENLITVKHQLSMTTGLDEQDDFCIEPECLKYKADAGTRWAYHTAPYNLLNRIIEKASGVSIDEYTKTKLADRIGLQHWGWDNHILSLSARDMARFGSLLLNKGKWNNESLIADTTYFNSMISSSSEFNKSYGYLWWLNGKDSYMVPNEDGVITGFLTPTAPADMYAAMGKGDKKIYVVPSLDLVVVRHGNDTGEGTFGPSSFDSDLWERLMKVINN
jgi:CubicO group peptidase (beta-lactamase class C family)